MRLSDFDFELPDDRIALRPAEPRDSARLLVVHPKEGLQDRRVSDLLDYLRPGDGLVLNDTRVIPARLSGVRIREDSTIACEATLHRRLGPDTWTAFMRPGKRLKVGDRIRFGQTTDQACDGAHLDATITHKGDGGELTLTFDYSDVTLMLSIFEHGQMPLPPYIAAKRPEDDRDRADYQTTFARHDGSVAAPTAGLHFTPELMARIEAMGVSIHYVTLHVGAGTFLPVKTDDVSDHKMHPEFGFVTAETATAINDLRARGGRAVCVGTTSLRLVESAADAAGQVQPFAAETSIFITPGYRFRAADMLMTNFHLPKSTLFMLVCAFAGTDPMKAAYDHALADRYRFYSYGDACLLWRAV